MVSIEDFKEGNGSLLPNGFISSGYREKELYMVFVPC
jgi:hypothetical protein